jgi:hypothetical protein
VDHVAGATYRPSFIHVILLVSTKIQTVDSNNLSQIGLSMYTLPTHKDTLYLCLKRLYPVTSHGRVEGITENKITIISLDTSFFELSATFSSILGSTIAGRRLTSNICTC